MLIAFDEKTHTYTADGVVIPSVTQIMTPLSQAYYKGISESTLNNAAERGTIVHNAIENYLKYGYDDCPAEYHGYFEAFLAWRDYFPHTYIASECRLYNDLLRYAGTADMIIRGANLDLCIVDFKTTAELNLDLVQVQLEAYAHAYRGEKVEWRQVVHLKPDGKYKHIYWKEDTKAYKVFTSCLAIYNYMKK